jgi:hypothetical protein
MEMKNAVHLSSSILVEQCSAIISILSAHGQRSVGSKMDRAAMNLPELPLTIFHLRSFCDLQFTRCVLGDQLRVA